MTEPSREKSATNLRISENGKPGDEAHVARYCAFCGEVVNGEPPERFGEVFCSEGHAEEFVQGVRAARARAAAMTAVEAGPAQPGQDAGPVTASPAQPNWKHLLKMAACCGVPLLALVVLAGGGGALLGAAGSFLPLLAFLACPLGMYFMMRGMSKGRHDGQSKDDDKAK